LTASYIHLRARSAYSLLRSTLTVATLAKLAGAHKMPALALTDENNLFGALEFSEKLSEKGLQPIIGCTFTTRISGSMGTADFVRVPLIARNEAGYRRLLHLSSLAYLTGQDRDGVANVTWQDLVADGEGLIALTGGIDGPLYSHLKRKEHTQALEALDDMSKAFGSGLYVELQRHGSADEATFEDHVVEMAFDRGLPVVATNDVLFPDPSASKAHEVLMCISEGAYLSQEERPRAPETAYFKSPGEMEELFSDIPEALEATVEIAQRCAVRSRGNKPMLPRFDAGDGLSEEEEMGRQAREGLERRLSVISLADTREAYAERLNEEIETICGMGFAGYFLIVSDFIKWAKANGIPVGPGRGSGAGSAVAWALEITDLDPLRFGLLFERFLNKERVSMPDFDVDFCQERREEVIEYVKTRYGADKVAQIITFGTLQARAVVRDVGRVMQLSYSQVDRFCKLIPNNPAAPTTLDTAVKTEEPIKQELATSAELRELVDIALQLEGLYRNASTHAAGIVIGNKPLSEIVPLFRDPRSPLPATQFNMKWVEPAGLVKFDFLGLKTLTVIERAVKFIARKGITVDVNQLPLDDKRTYELLAAGQTLGVFQLEGQGMRDTLRKMRSDSLEDIIALISLYRPGPMKNIDTYVDAKFGRVAPDYLHPRLEPILKETYGVIIYQEQVMQIAQVLSGYSLGQADLLRRAMGKKKPEEMAAQKAIFVDGAAANGVDRIQAERIFYLVEEFAGYGFNKSHAAAYALISYQTAWLKANHPVEFMAASMSLDLTNTDKLAIFVQDARRMGLEIVPPDVNATSADFDVSSDGKILYALGAIRNVSLGAMEALVEERRRSGPYKDVFDMARRVDAKALNKRMLENIAKAGGFDSLLSDRATAFAAAEPMAAIAARASEDRASSQVSLFGDAAAEPPPRLLKVKPLSERQRLDAEREAIGFYISGHPLASFFDGVGRDKFETYYDALASLGEARSRVSRMAAVVRDVQERSSKLTGDRFAYVSLSDPTGDYELMVRAEDLVHAKPILKVGTAVVFECRFRVGAEGEIRASGGQFEPLANLEARTAKDLKVRLVEPQKAFDVAKLLDGMGAPGADGERRRLRLTVTLRDGREIEIAPPGRWIASAAARSALEAQPGVSTTL
jgi:DNA polymerase III subunit alpha